jgi:hypothetical protein
MQRRPQVRGKPSARSGHKECTTRYAKRFAGMLLVILLATCCALAQDPGWPRKLTRPGGTAIFYQPQVDDWQNYSQITWREAFQLTPKGGKQLIGAATMTGATNVDTDKHTVVIYGIQITNSYFPDLDPATSASMGQLLQTFIPPVVNISLERVVAYMPKPQTVSNTVQLNNTPPFIFVSYTPAILLQTDGEPVLAAIPNTQLKYIVNTQWPAFFDTRNSQYYLLVGPRWFSSFDLHGPWNVTTTLPKDMVKLPQDQRFAVLAKAIPAPPNARGPIPQIFYAAIPSEVILFDGQPQYAPIPQTQLVYATNTDSPVFVYTPTNEYYYLAAGRWFKSSNLQGQWTFATLDLPADFARIPASSPASMILSSVPGTEEAKDAVLIAQIPTTMFLNPTTAAAQAKVTYTGDPQFAPIEGTTLQYATNTPDKVIQVGEFYYLCLQGVWFVSSTPQGPWTTAPNVPQVIYTIPPSSPVYNVTYVTQVTVSDGNVQSSYTAGYLGAFVMGAAVGAIVCSGTGYYYPPYIGYPAYGYPVYHPYATPYGAYGTTPYYNTHNGSYGYATTTYGAYGSTTHAASYNPYTGTYKEGTSVSTPYGKQSAGQAYNPYTGTYGATHQGSSPTAQWGQSYVQQGNKSAYTQHYSTANGTVASAQGSQGGKAYGTSTAYGNTYAGKNSSGDMYAGHDGNVYQKSGSSWQKYNNSTNSWQTVDKQTAQQTGQQDKSTYEQEHPNSQATAQQDKSNYEQQHPSSQSYDQSHPSSSSMSSDTLNSEMQNRQRGSSQSDSWSHGGSSGGWGGGGRSWGGGGGGSYRR